MGQRQGYGDQNGKHWIQGARLSVSVFVTGKMSYGHITPVRMVGRLT